LILFPVFSKGILGADEKKATQATAEARKLILSKDDENTCNIFLKREIVTRLMEFLGRASKYLSFV